MNSFAEMRNLCQNITNVLNGLAELEERKEKGEDVSEEVGTLMVKLFEKLMEIRKLAND